MQLPVAYKHPPELVRPIPLSEIKKQIEVLGHAEKFFESQVLFSLFELGVFAALVDGPKTADELAASIACDVDGAAARRGALRAILDAAVALRLLRREVDRYTASEGLLAGLGRKDGPAYLGEWITFLDSFVRPLQRLTEVVRTGEPAYALHGDMNFEPVAVRLTEAMDAYARTRGIEIADRVDFSGARALLDLGCGPGTYSLAILERNPELRATLLDLPGPIAVCRRLVEQRGMLERVELVAADALTYATDATFDVILISNTLHQIGPDASRALLARCYPMLAPGGRIVVQAQYLNDDRVSPRWPTLLNLIQLVTTSDGRNHTIGETIEWMQGAGYVSIEHVPFAMWNVCSCLIGRRGSVDG